MQRSKLNPDGDFYYDDINFRVPAYVYRPLTRENSGILKSKLDYGIFRGKTNYKWAEKVALDHMFNLRSQYRKLVEMNMESNRNERLKNHTSAYSYPTMGFSTRLTRYPASTVAHATRIYPAVEPPRQRRGINVQPQEEDETVQRTIDIARREGVPKRRRELRERLQDEEEPDDNGMYVKYKSDFTHPKIKEVSSLAGKVKPAKQTNTRAKVPVSGDITNVMQQKEFWRKQSKSKRPKKKKTSKKRVQSASEETDPIAIREHDNIEAIEEKDEKEEEDQANQQGDIGAGSGVKKGNWPDMSKGSKNNQLPNEAAVERKQTAQIGERAGADPKYKTDSHVHTNQQVVIETVTKQGYGPNQGQEVITKQTNIRNVTSGGQGQPQSTETYKVVSSVQEGGSRQAAARPQSASPPQQRGSSDRKGRDMAEDSPAEDGEEPDELIRAVWDDIPVLMESSQEAMDDFINGLANCLNKYGSQGTDALEAIMKATYKKNPRISSEDLAQIFDEILADFRGEEEELDQDYELAE